MKSHKKRQPLTPGQRAEQLELFDSWLWDKHAHSSIINFYPTSQKKLWSLNAISKNIINLISL